MSNKGIKKRSLLKKKLPKWTKAEDDLVRSYVEEVYAENGRYDFN